MAICPEDAIAMGMVDGQCLPSVDSKRCSGCGSCLDLCPGLRVDPHGLMASGLTDATHLAGTAVYTCAAKLKDGEILKRTASGGVVTGMALELLGQGSYDLVSVVGGIGSHTTAARAVLTKTPEEIIRCAGSRYVPVSAFNIVRALEDNKNCRVVITATPCLLDGISNYARLRGVDLDRILFIGLFCELTMNLNFVEYVRRLCDKTGEDVKLLEYKNKLIEGQPGNMRVVFSGGREATCDKKKRIEAKPYFQLRRCLYCTDKLNRAADISVGDCFVKYLKDREGISSVIVRTSRGREAFSACEDLFLTEPLSLSQICVTQGLAVVGERAERMAALLDVGAPSQDRNTTPCPPILPSGHEVRRIKLGATLDISGIAIDISIQKARDRVRRIKKYFLIALVLLWRVVGDAPRILFGEVGKRRDMRATGIIGANSQNRGAQSMALTVIDRIRRQNPESTIYLLADDFDREEGQWKDFLVDLLPWDGHTKLRLLCPNKLRNRLDPYLNEPSFHVNPDAYREIGSFFDVSGYALSSKWTWKKSITYLENIMLARKLGASVELLSQSFGPWDYPAYAKTILYPLLYLYLKYPVKVFARERVSKEFIQRFSPHVELSTDIVLASDGYDEQCVLRPDSDLREPYIQESLVGIIPNTKVFERIGSRRFFSVYDDVIRFLGERGLGALLLCYSDEDKVLCQAIRDRNQKEGVIKGFMSDLNAIEFEHVVGRLNFIVSSRYHSIVHAYRNGIPAIVIGWAEKYDSLLEAFNQKDYLLRPDCVDRDIAVRHSLARMLDRREKEKRVISEALEAIRRL